VVMFSSCQKYYLDSGTHDPVYDGTVMDYIKQRKDIFDSLYKVIQFADMESTLNRQGVTFFAPGDASIRKAIFQLNSYLYVLGRDTVQTMDQVDPSVWKEYLSMYIYNNTYVLKDIPQLDTNNMNVFPGQGFISVGNQNMNIGVIYNNVETKDKQVIEYAGYRQLFLSYILDVSNTGGFGSMVNAPVATSDIRTRNGVIHALEYKRHTFGFISSNFVNAAYSKGIKY
ncbi:MAG TPA: fasciclin domain-containing protein, partial [Sphingobacterium sp.]|nr:fasciclin domain-containing protein [Sphingobacterium sp.]